MSPLDFIYIIYIYTFQASKIYKQIFNRFAEIICSSPSSNKGRLVLFCFALLLKKYSIPCLTTDKRHSLLNQICSFRKGKIRDSSVKTASDPCRGFFWGFPGIPTHLLKLWFSALTYNSHLILHTIFLWLIFLVLTFRFTTFLTSNPSIII